MGMCEDANCAECRAAKDKEDLLATLSVGQPTPLTELPADFRGFSSAFKQRGRMVRFYPSKGKAFRHKPSGQPKGKAAIKAAKRERVKALKAQETL